MRCQYRPTGERFILQLHVVHGRFSQLQYWCINITFLFILVQALYAGTDSNVAGQGATAYYATNRPTSQTGQPFNRCGSLFAVYVCNGTEFSYVIFTEQRNVYNGRTVAKRQRKTATK